MRIDTLTVAQTAGHLALWAKVHGLPLDGAEESGVTVDKLDKGQLEAVQAKLPTLEAYSLSEKDWEEVKGAASAVFLGIVKRAKDAGIEGVAKERAKAHKGEVLSLKAFEAVFETAMGDAAKTLTSKATLCEAHLLAQHKVSPPKKKAKAGAATQDF